MGRPWFYRDRRGHCLLATLALLENQPTHCLMWLGVALIVDGLDGALARKVNVQSVLPSFDGSILDLVIDYLTYVFIPALFIYRYIPLPDYTLLLTVSLILVSSLFCFCNVNMKSKDNYFVGFPAAWNVVALCLYIIGPGRGSPDRDRPGAADRDPHEVPAPVPRAPVHADQHRGDGNLAAVQPVAGAQSPGDQSAGDGVVAADVGVLSGDLHLAYGAGVV
jgi:hypothetical protein